MILPPYRIAVFIFSKGCLVSSCVELYSKASMFKKFLGMWECEMEIGGY